MIILEGIDKTGKTTLANYLSKELGFPIIKFSEPKKGEDPYYEYCKFLANTDLNCILDRYYLSELVYGRIKRGKSEIDKVKQKILELALQKCNVMAVYCQNDMAFIKNKFTEDKETYTKVEEIKPILNGYTKEIDKSLLKWHNYKIGDDMQKLADKYRVFHKH